MICPNCGAQLPEHAKFCIECGTRLTVIDNAIENELKEIGESVGIDEPVPDEETEVPVREIPVEPEKPAEESEEPVIQEEIPPVPEDPMSRIRNTLEHLKDTVIEETKRIDWKAIADYFRRNPKKLAGLIFALLVLVALVTPEKHKWSEPTCTKPAICADCGETSGKPLGHEFSEATCISDGVCIRCGTVGTVKLNHQFSNVGCEETPVCERCGEKGKPSGHKIAAFNVVTEATCVNDGEQTGKCSVCGKQISEAIKATGIHTAEFKVTKEPTCVDSGVQEGTCAVCEQLITEEVAATGNHTYEKATTAEPTCTKEGTEEMTCKVCGDKVTQKLAKLDHKDDEKWVTEKEATEKRDGLRATHCTMCGKVMREEVVSLTKEQKNAIGSAKSYISFLAFSRKGLIEQLEYEGYSHDASVFAVDYLNIDWNEQAKKCARNYLDFMNFSRSGLIDQLEYEGFTYDQAVYGVTANGY